MATGFAWGNSMALGPTTTIYAIVTRPENEIIRLKVHDYEAESYVEGYNKGSGRGGGHAEILPFTIQLPAVEPLASRS